MIKCVEIENPYRYRSYQVGKETLYDVQNETIGNPDHGDNYGKVVEIVDTLDMFDTRVIYIRFDSGNRIEISAGAGLVIIHKEEEDGED